jgi:selenocysteine lyase/cysteine desulfurase
MGSAYRNRENARASEFSLHARIIARFFQRVYAMPIQVPPSSDPAVLARDEAWWAHVASFYPKPTADFVNLEHGYFGAMSSPVSQAYEEGIRYLNQHLSPFLRGEFVSDTLDAMRDRLAALINAKRDEILFTRSASESMQVLIGQYRGLSAGDTVLWCNLDYSAMRDAMQWLEKRHGVTAIEMEIDLPITRDEILARYKAAMRYTPNLKLILLSQVSPFNGQAMPIKEIVAMARKQGIDVLVDCAHGLGQLPVDVEAMQLDFAGFNLHKWIGAPPGLGFVYIRKSHLHKIDTHFGASDFAEDDIRSRLYAGMLPVGAILALPAALEFHHALGGTLAKRARLQYLSLPGFRLFGSAEDIDLTALVSFGLDGFSATELQNVLFERFRIFTVERKAGNRSVLRATVTTTTKLGDLDLFVEALTTLTNNANTPR